MGGAHQGARDIAAVDYERAAQVRPEERDWQLGVNSKSWHEDPPKDWSSVDNGLARIILGEGSGGTSVPESLEELVLRFPSAPIHGLQRLHEHHMELGKSENFHTFRILRSADPEAIEQPISRIFLFHTGLNEAGTMGFYYNLSSRLIREESTTVCLVRPFPGHLTRYPFQAFAETPLDLYLWDGSHLFRQFVRFMIETRWLLSTLVRRSSYRCASGANLLAESDELLESRLDSRYLAEEMMEEWAKLHTASSATAGEEEMREQQLLDDAGLDPHQKRPELNYPPVDAGEFLTVIETIRAALNLEDHFEPLSGDLEKDQGAPEPSFHALGYSLGGFTAQSVFMSWPFVVSSCSTLLAGGALRELAPTGFADPEEWQTVLHSLRYELDDRMMNSTLGVSSEAAAGIDRNLFTYLKRTFYEVFQQEYRGSIQTRYEAFGDRMLFVVGGNDPVVRPESVLQSGPKGGLNLLEIGGLGHFLQDGGSDAQGEYQKAFWIPEMAALIHNFSNNVASEHRSQRQLTWFDPKLAKPLLSRAKWNTAMARRKKVHEEIGNEEAIVRQLSPAEVVGIEHDGALPGELFERCLDDLMHRVSIQRDGLLFAFRNEVPTAYLPASAVRETGAALYHDDLSIARYCHGIAARQQVIQEHVDRMCLVLPWNARSIVRRMDMNRAYPSQAESAGGLVADRLGPDDVWRASLAKCFRISKSKKGKESIRVFNGNESEGGASGEEGNEALERLVEASRSVTHDLSRRSPPSLPDTWVWVSNAFLVPQARKQPDVKEGIRRFIESAPEACESPRTMLDHVRDGDVRIVAVSRARYNPRFRGRLLVDGKAARKRFLHTALCLGMSSAISGLKPEQAFV